MLTNISEEELSFIECLCDPICLTECLFHDVDALGLYEEKQFCSLRIGQFPMMSYEYMIDYDPKLSEKDNFRLKEGAGSIWCFGGRRFGKCNSVDSLITLADGNVKRLGDLINKKEYVISLNQETWKLEKSVAEFFDNGKKECIKFITDSGKSDTVTFNHPLLTQNGWKTAEKLTTKDYLATVKDYGSIGTKKTDENIAKLLGYLIGDGGCTCNGVTFTNIDSELVGEFLGLVKYFGCDYRKRGITYNIKRDFDKFRRKQYVKGIGYIPGEGRKSSKILELVRKYKINKLSKHKIIPVEVFSWDNNSIAILLNRLYACDGYVEKGGSIAITLASKQLIKDIQHLLLRFGVDSAIYYKSVKLKDKEFDAWSLYITSFNHSKRFMSKIGIKSKQNKYDYTQNKKSKTDFIPKEFLINLEHKFKGIKKETNFRKRKLYRNSIEKWQELYKIVPDKEIEKIVNSDIRWEKVKTLEIVTNVDTVVVSVPNNNTYISNDIISHNSLCVEKLDIFCDGINNPANKVGFNSYDAGHIEGMLEDVIVGWEQHPFLKMFNSKRIKRNPYTIRLRSGWSLIGINSNNSGKNPGDQFFQKHLKKLYIEEAAQEITKVYEKRIDAVDELGCVFRIAGMTNFTKYSPAGRAFYDLKNKPWIMNVPQYINPQWDEKEKKRAIKKHQGEQSVSYRIFVKGEVVEDGICVSEDSKILLSDFSTKEIKNVGVGDELLAFEETSSRPGVGRKLVKSKVLEKIDNGIRKVYEIQSNDNKLWLTPDHRVIGKKPTLKNSHNNLKWYKIEECLNNNYTVLSFDNFIYNKENYFWGVLLGIISSDGTRIYDKNSDKHSIYITQSQSCEWKSFEWVFKYLGVEYKRYLVKTKGPRYKDMFRYCIIRKHNEEIINREKLLLTDKDSALGFICGFILGDGWVTKDNLNICQSVKVNKRKCQLLEDIFRIFKIKHSSYVTKRNIITYCFSAFSILPYCPFSYKFKKFEKVIQNKIPISLDKTVIKTGESCKRVYDLVTTTGTFIANGFFIHNSVLDMERVRKCYTERRKLKTFEINKDNFAHFKQLLILEKPNNVEVCYICADVGETAPTEIIIMFKINKIYQYHYNITCYNLTHKQQFKLFEWLSQKLEAHYVGIDTTDQLGRAIFRDLEDSIGRHHLIWTGFNEKIAIGFEKDDNDNWVLKDGKPVHKMEYVDAWSIQRLKHLFYEELMNCPLDDKLDSQLNSVVASQSANRTLYECRAEADHLLAAFRVFAIAEWSNAFNLIAPVMKKKFCKLGV